MEGLRARVAVLEEQLGSKGQSLDSIAVDLATRTGELAAKEAELAAGRGEMEGMRANMEKQVGICHG